MSLLNDALRKKEGEPRPKVNTHTVPKRTAAGSNKSKRIVGLAVIICLATGLAVMFAWDMFFSSERRPSPALRERVDQQSQPGAENDSSSLGMNTDTQILQEEKLLESQKAGMPHSEAVKTDAVVSDSGFEIQDTHKTVPAVPSRKKSKKKEKHLKPKSKPFPDEGMNNIDYQKALVLHSENQLDQAMRMYLRVLQKNPDHTGANFNLAAIYLQRGQYIKAHTLLEKCRYFDPDNPRIVISLAIAALGMGDPKRALMYLNQAETFRIKPGFEVDFHKGVAYSHMNDFQQALHWYKKAEKIDPRNLKLLFNIALAYDNLKQYPEALTYYHACLRRSGELSDEDARQVMERAGVLRRFTMEKSEPVVEEDKAAL